MSFHDPNYFYWLAALPFIAIIYGFRIYVRQNLITKWLNLQKNFLTSLISEKKRALKMGLRILTMLLLFTALARPQSAGEKVDIYNKGIHLLLLIDVSKSMLAEDIKPNRLSFVQKKISELIDLSSGDQIALGVFASSLLLITPFTNDLTAIKSYLNDLSADYLSNQGTDFGRAFQSSIKIFSDLKDNEREKSVKAVVLVSDG